MKRTHGGLTTITLLCCAQAGEANRRIVRGGEVTNKCQGCESAVFTDIYNIRFSAQTTSDISSANPACERIYVLNPCFYDTCESELSHVNRDDVFPMFCRCFAGERHHLHLPIPILIVPINWVNRLRFTPIINMTFTASPTREQSIGGGCLSELSYRELPHGTRAAW